MPEQHDLLQKNEVSTPKITYAEAIRLAIDIMMLEDDRVVLIGEGVPDPKAIFNTTYNLQKKYGSERVFDMPLAENALTGICIGAALTGLRPIMVHQRLDFALLAMDQLVNNAAKWHVMFGGQHHVPLVVRMLVGRGWGQGPQHSQSLQVLFAHIPGLKVVMPAFPEDAKGMLISAIKDNNPVIFIEHRWLHLIQGRVPEGSYSTPLDRAKLVHLGNDISLAAISYMVVEALAVAEVLNDIGIGVEVIDLRSCSPLDSQAVITSAHKTHYLLIAETGHKTFGIAAELSAQVTEACFESLKAAPIRIASPDYAISTSHFSSIDYYPEALEIADTVLKCLGKDSQENIDFVKEKLTRSTQHDVPNPEYRSPF